MLEINMEALIEDTCLHSSNDSNEKLTQSQKKVKLAEDTDLANKQALELLKIAQKCVKEGSVSLIRLMLDQKLAFLWPNIIRNKFLQSLNVLYIFYFLFFFFAFFSHFFFVFFCFVFF